MKIFAYVLACLLIASPVSAQVMTGGAVGPQGPTGNASGTGTTGQIPQWTNGAIGELGDSGVSWSSPCQTVGTDVFNQVLVCGSVTGSPVTISAAGSDTDIGLLLNGKGLYQVWINGGHSTGLIVDGKHEDPALIAFNEPVPGPPVLIAADGGVPGDGALGLLAYGTTNASGVIERIVTTRGTPDALDVNVTGDKIFTQIQYADTAAAYQDVVAQYQSTLRLDGLGGAGADQIWTGYIDAGTPIPFMTFSAAASGAGSPGSLTLQGGSSGIDLDATTASTIILTTASTIILNSTSIVASGSLTVTTRTGTPAAFACFDSTGKLVESAVACQ